MYNQKIIKVFEHESLRLGQQGFNQNHWTALIKLNELHGDKYFRIIHNGVRFKEYVGVVQIDDLTIEILPKIDKDLNADWQKVLIRMLQVCRKLSPDANNEANVNKQNISLIDLYFELFLKEVNKLIRLGLTKKYRKETGNVKALKGKLEFAGHLSKNLIHKERFYTSHSVYDTDHLLHQVISEALNVVEQLSKGTYISDKCKRTKLSFPDVSRIRVKQSLFDRIQLNRKTKPYEKAIELARLILLNYSPDIEGGKEKMLALLFDMNTLWEEYVLRVLQRASKGFDGMKVIGQAQKKFWENRRVKPDIVITHKNNDTDETIVIDTKWKRLTNNRADIADLRQMYVYNKYWDAKKSLLLYPKGNKYKENVSGRFYTDGKNTPDDNNTCEIGYLDIIEGENLSNDWGVKFLEELTNPVTI